MCTFFPSHALPCTAWPLLVGPSCFWESCPPTDPRTCWLKLPMYPSTFVLWLLIYCYFAASLSARTTVPTSFSWCLAQINECFTRIYCYNKRFAHLKLSVTATKCSTSKLCKDKRLVELILAIRHTRQRLFPKIFHLDCFKNKGPAHKTRSPKSSTPVTKETNFHESRERLLQRPVTFSA